MASLADTIADRVGRKYAVGDDEPAPDPARAGLLKCSADAMKAVHDGDEGGFLDAMLRLMDERDSAPVTAPRAPAEEADDYDPDLE